ncbi:MAG: NADH-quinone oxidoreductase subunit N [Chloroflexi bacterium]|nr:NADH-quinone oxidoreductase subunit N [Chloroflexota bacterium]
MNLHDVYLLSPELSLAGLAALLLMLDLVVQRKRLLSILSIICLIVPAGFVVALWLDLGRDNVPQMTGLFDTLVVDRFSLFFKALFLGIVGLVLMASIDYAAKFQRFQTEYCALVILSAVGMMLLASTQELISIYIALELTALPLAALAAFLRESRSSEAGMKFLILSAISSAVLLYGMVLIFGFTGSTFLKEIASELQRLPLSGDIPFGSYALLLGIVLMIAGFGFKISAVPFQMWVPDVYEGAPTPITAYLSVASKAAGFAVILRVFYTAFPASIISVDWGAVFAVLSALSMTIGNLVAIAQNNIKRMLAYSTIAHAGYIMVGLAAIAARSPQEETFGPAGILFYLGAYAATNLTAFFAVIAISNWTGSDAINDFAGMSRRSPFLAFALAFAMISLIGLPPAAGFIAKVYIFGAAVNSNLVWLAIVGVINSVVSAYYYLRVVRVMYLSPRLSEEPISISPSIKLAVAISGAAVAFFGIFPLPLLRFAEEAASILPLVAIAPR